jgi:hypothetical protein
MPGSRYKVGHDDTLAPDLQDNLKTDIIFEYDLNVKSCDTLAGVMPISLQHRNPV